MTAATITRVRQVLVSAVDFDAQAKFIEQTLGLELQFRDGEQWAQYQAGGISLALAGPRESLDVPPGQSVAVFEVDDLDALCSAVLKAGGTCSAIREMGDHGRTAKITDPNGSAYAALQKSDT